MWKLQAYGLVAITLLSFFPRFFHFQEYAFFFLLAVALCLSWAEKTNPVVRTPIDLPLLGFVAWVLCTVPFAIDPAYSFSEWRKLVTQVLVFYWSMLVLHRHRQTDLGRLLVWAVIGGSLALSVFALGDFVLRGGTWKDRLVRAGAPSSDYNWLTTYLVLVIPILIGWCLIQRTMRERARALESLRGRNRANCRLHSGRLGGSCCTGDCIRDHGRATATGHMDSCGCDRHGGRRTGRLRDRVSTGNHRSLDPQCPRENLAAWFSPSRSASDLRRGVRERHFSESLRGRSRSRKRQRCSGESPSCVTQHICDGAHGKRCAGGRSFRLGPGTHYSTLTIRTAGSSFGRMVFFYSLRPSLWRWLALWFEISSITCLPAVSHHCFGFSWPLVFPSRMVHPLKWIRTKRHLYPELVKELLQVWSCTFFSCRYPMNGTWQHILETSSARALALMISLASLSVTARVLGPEGRGIIAGATTWINLLATLGSLSVGQV